MEVAKAICERSILIKAIYELWRLGLELGLGLLTVIRI
jgi:hypothetical protein